MWTSRVSRRLALLAVVLLLTIMSRPHKSCITAATVGQYAPNSTWKLPAFSCWATNRKWTLPLSPSVRVWCLTWTRIWTAVGFLPLMSLRTWSNWQCASSPRARIPYCSNLPETDGVATSSRSSRRSGTIECDSWRKCTRVASLSSSDQGPNRNMKRLMRKRPVRRARITSPKFKRQTDKDIFYEYRAD